MRHLGTPEDLIDKINNLTTKGTFRVKMFKKLSAETEKLSGIGQGCPDSALKIDINHEGNLLIYSNMDLSWSLRIYEEKTELAVFADDSGIPVQLESVADYEELLRFFNTLSGITGFSINQSKTEKLAFNTPRELIERINALGKGKIVLQVQHLTIFLTSEEHNMEEANYEFLPPRLEAAMNGLELKLSVVFVQGIYPSSLDQSHKLGNFQCKNARGGCQSNLVFNLK